MTLNGRKSYQWSYSSSGWVRELGSKGTVRNPRTQFDEAAIERPFPRMLKGQISATNIQEQGPWIEYKVSWLYLTVIEAQRTPTIPKPYDMVSTSSFRRWEPHKPKANIQTIAQAAQPAAEWLGYNSEWWTNNCLNNIPLPWVMVQSSQDGDNEMAPTNANIQLMNEVIEVWWMATYAAIRKAPDTRMGFRPVRSTQITAGMVARNILDTDETPRTT